MVLLKIIEIVTERTPGGETLLMITALANETEVLTVLLRTGTKVSDRTTGGLNLLMCAAGKNPNPNVLTVLLRAGADGKAKCKEGKTAFEYAKDNAALKDTPAYWALKDAQY